MGTLIRNAYIEDIVLEVDEDYNDILTALLIVEYANNYKKCFGKVRLSDSRKKFQTEHAVNFILKCLEITDAANWNDIKGKPVRVVINEENSKIIEIGHIIKDVWFNPYTKINSEENLMPSHPLNTVLEKVQEINNEELAELREKCHEMYFKMSYEELIERCKSDERLLHKMYLNKQRVLVLCHHFYDHDISVKELIDLIKDAIK